MMEPKQSGIGKRGRLNERATTGERLRTSCWVSRFVDPARLGRGYDPLCGDKVMKILRRRRLASRKGYWSRKAFSAAVQRRTGQPRLRNDIGQKPLLPLLSVRSRSR